MRTDAVVNTANAGPTVGGGCDRAVYEAAGYEKLPAYRREYTGQAKAGDVFMTPGFGLSAKVIIHAVGPVYIDGGHGEEELLRSCYRKSLALAEKTGIRSIAIPLISTGGLGYPREEGMRIAVDEIRAFLSGSSMDIYLVALDEKSSRIGNRYYPDLEAYIDRNYVEEKRLTEYGGWESWQREASQKNAGWKPMPGGAPSAPKPPSGSKKREADVHNILFKKEKKEGNQPFWDAYFADRVVEYSLRRKELEEEEAEIKRLKRGLAERLEHRSDTFSEYLLYLIRSKGMENSDVYRRAIVDKKVFSKIKNNPEYHPQKRTALCLCVGAKLNLDESKDLLARAGYALSPCDKTDIIFSYFIEYKIYDMIELDIQLEEHGLPCIIS